MDNPSDEAIAEALRLAGYAHSKQSVLAVLDEPDTWREILAHARTIDQRNKLVEALEFYADEKAVDPNAGPWGVNSQDFGRRASKALTQFRSGQ